MKILKWIGIVLGSLIGLIVIIAVGVYLSVEMRLNKTYDVPAETIAIPSDAPALARGKHWATVYCSDCHGANLGGNVMFEDPSLGRIAAPNLTAGKGGMSGAHTDADWVRAIRHGVGQDRKPLAVMPAGDFYNLSDGDLGDIIAYVKSVPSVDNNPGTKNFTFFGHVLIAMGAFGDVISA